jgi:hypothetical protein
LPFPVLVSLTVHLQRAFPAVIPGCE